MNPGIKESKTQTAKNHELVHEKHASEQLKSHEIKHEKFARSEQLQHLSHIASK